MSFDSEASSVDEKLAVSLDFPYPVQPILSSNQMSENVALGVMPMINTTKAYPKIESGMQQFVFDDSSFRSPFHSDAHPLIQITTDSENTLNKHPGSLSNHQSQTDATIDIPKHSTDISIMDSPTIKSKQKSAKSNPSASRNAHDPNKLTVTSRKPSNAFFIYRREKHKHIIHCYKNAKKQLPNNIISKLIAVMWRQETEAAKQKYFELARVEKLKWLVSNSTCGASSSTQSLES